MNLVDSCSAEVKYVSYPLRVISMLMYFLFCKSRFLLIKPFFSILVNCSETLCDSSSNSRATLAAVALSPCLIKVKRTTAASACMFHCFNSRTLTLLISFVVRRRSCHRTSSSPKETSSLLLFFRLIVLLLVSFYLLCCLIIREL